MKMRLLSLCVLGWLCMVGSHAESADSLDIRLRLAADPGADERIAAAAREAAGGQVIKQGDVRAKWVPLAPNVRDKVSSRKDVVLDGRGNLLVLVGKNDVVDSVDKWYQTLDNRGLPAISVWLTEEGSRKLENLTSENKGRLLAVILDGQVTALPEIKERLSRIFVIPAPADMIVGAGETAELVPIEVILHVGVILAAGLGGFVVFWFERKQRGRWLSGIASFLGATAGAYKFGVEQHIDPAIQGLLHYTVRISLVALLVGYLLGLGGGWGLATLILRWTGRPAARS